MNKYKFPFVLALTSTLLSGCGGSSSSSPSTDSAKTGVFLDSPVINIGYRTETLEGVTNSLGEYQYIEGETVTFFIGDLELPSVAATGTVTPLEIAGTQDTSNSEVVNIIRLLQTLDKDGNPDNGITITETAVSAATQVDFTLSVSDFAASSSVSTLISIGGQDSVVEELVSASSAIAHFEEELISRNPSFSGVWELPGTILIFLEDGRYFGIEWENQLGSIGFERGSYSKAGSSVSFSVVQNNDGDALLCNVDEGLSCSNNTTEFTVTSEELTFTPPDEDSFSLERQPLFGNQIEGVWELPGTILIFLEDGRYFGIEWENQLGSIGFERGSYSKAGSSVSFSVVQNNDGDALLCNVDEGLSCSNNTTEFTVTSAELTFTPPDEDSFSLTRLF